MCRWIQLMLVGGMLVSGFVGCKKQAPVQTEPSESAMTVEPQGGSPGMIVRVSATKPIFGRGQEAKIEIGGQLASIARVVSDTEAEVMVPQVREGQTTIGISGGRKDSAAFTVLPARAQQLILKMTGGRIELVAVHATSGEPSGRGELSGGPQLSFDVLNQAGAVIYTGTIPRPTERMEVFDGPDANSAVIRREKMDHETTFALKVPMLAAETTVKFFEAPPDANTQDLRTREGRKFIAEIKVPRGKE